MLIVAGVHVANREISGEFSPSKFRSAGCCWAIHRITVRSLVMAIAPCESCRFTNQHSVHTELKVTFFFHVNTAFYLVEYALTYCIAEL